MYPTMQESSLPNIIEMDTIFSDFLSPIRDPTKNWEVNIAAALEEYLSKLEGLHLTFHNGCLSLNFAQAALIIQRSTSVYCKKVEYLCSLCQQVLHVISSERRIQSQTSEVSKEKDLVSCPSTACDDFCSLDDIKVQKGLDLVEDERNYNNRRNSTLPFTPVMLIRLEEREKGQTSLLNFKGEVVGNRQDYYLNICELDDSGGLTFPMSSSEFFRGCGSPISFDSPESNEADFCRESIADDCASSRCYSPCPDFDGLVENADIDVPTEKENGGVPIEKEDCSVSTRNDNIDIASKTNDFADLVEEVPFALPSLPVDNIKGQRKSLRQNKIKMLKQAAEKIDSAKKGSPVPPLVAKPVKRRVVKRRIPPKKPTVETSLLTDPAQGFQCRAFYSHEVELENDLTQSQDALTAATVDTLLLERFEQESNFQEDQNVPRANEDKANSSDGEDNAGCPFPDIDDHSDGSPDSNQPVDNVTSCSTNTGIFEAVPDYEEFTHKSIENYLKSIAHYCQTDDLTKKVNEWEERIKPILRIENRREVFDIHSCQNKILNNFEANNRKQTVSLSEICKGKEKWEVCRYFLASLQLANNYNVSISTDASACENDVELTLMSRKTDEEH